MSVQNQFTATLFFAAALHATPVFAGDAMNGAMDHGMMGDMKMQGETAAMQYEGQGVIKAAKEGKVQIEHQAISSLQWPAMTMWFLLQDALPQSVKVGDSVHFVLQQQGKQWIVTHIERSGAGK